MEDENVEAVNGQYYREKPVVAGRKCRFDRFCCYCSFAFLKNIFY